MSEKINVITEKLINDAKAEDKKVVRGKKGTKSEGLVWIEDVRYQIVDMMPKKPKQVHVPRDRDIKIVSDKVGDIGVKMIYHREKDGTKQYRIFLAKKIDGKLKRIRYMTEELRENQKDEKFVRKVYDSIIAGKIKVKVAKEEIYTNAVIEKAKEIEEEIASLNVDGASQKAIVNVRVNQGKFRDLLLTRYNRCCLCGVENPALLIASHIKPWAKSEPKEKLDVDNGFLMCPNHDRLFDKGYITFDDDGKIIISEGSEGLTENDKVFLNVNSRMHIDLTDRNKKYLKFHRENVFIDK